MDITGKTLAVSADRRYFTLDGKPFFYLADTAWTLFKRLAPEDVDLYLNDRTQRGFTVIQAYVLRGLKAPNLAGEFPLVNDDPTQLNEGFFSNVDQIVKRASQLGLAMGLVATMGEHVRHQVGEERFGEAGEQILTAANAFRFGELLGKRYRDAVVCWFLGGDRQPRPADVAKWDSMASGLKAGSAGRHLVSYHSCGGESSSGVFHGRAWLDFNTTQSLHGSGDPNYRLIAIDRSLSPVKPTFDMEARYEGHPDLNVHPGIASLSEAETIVRISADQARQAAYWDIFAGGCGHGYGHSSIWQLHDPVRVESQADYSFPLLPADLTWRSALSAPGATQLGYLRRLMELFPWYLSEPFPALIVAAASEDEDRASALRSLDASFALAYLSWGSPIRIDLTKLNLTSVRCTWFDPRTGQAGAAQIRPAGGEDTFTAPTSGPGQDWVLILDRPS